MAGARADRRKSRLDHHGPRIPRGLQTLLLQRTAIDDEPQIRLADLCAIESQGAPASGFTARVPHAHALIRKNPAGGQRIPYTADLEQPLRRAAQGVDAQIPIGGRPGPPAAAGRR